MTALTAHVTSGGPHPSGWSAAVAVDQIIQVEPTAQGVLAADGEKLKTSFLVLLSKYFDWVQETERSKSLAEMDAPLLVSDAGIKTVVESLVSASVGSIHEAFFKMEPIQEALKAVIIQRTLTAIDIERKWRKDSGV